MIAVLNRLPNSQKQANLTRVYFKKKSPRVYSSIFTVSGSVAIEDPYDCQYLNHLPNSQKQPNLTRVYFTVCGS